MRSTIFAVLLALTATASAENVILGRWGYHFTQPKGITSAADTHLLFLNPCTGGCTVHSGSTDNRTDTSDIAQSTITLSAFNQGDTVWQGVMSCARDTFSRFNVTVTDVDPGSTPHMEVMVAGVATELLGSQGNGVGGIADFPCQSIGSCDSFMPNALVFAFANDPYYSGDPDNICSTVAQEIAHTWALDHVVDASDPMTYNQYSGIRQYHDNETCGSDCFNGTSPFGLTCTGSGGQATHTCALGGATQNEVQVILALFGSSVPDTQPPAVMITSPTNGSTVVPGFTVTATITDNVTVVSGEMKLDGTSLGKIGGPTFTWTTNKMLAPGNHHIDVIGTDGAGNTTTASADVGYGAACHSTSDCTDKTDICDNGHCVPGPGAPGGLGSPCTSNMQCNSNQCADDGQGHEYCVEQCTPGQNTCPSGFGCVASGSSGVCWPGADGGGGCDTTSTTGGSSGGALIMFAGLGVALLVRRRK